MSILQKYLDMLTRASVKHRSARVKIIAVILGFSTFFIIIPFVLFFAANAVERLVPANVWRTLEIIFSLAAICVGLLILAGSTLSQAKIGKGTPGSGCCDSKADLIRSIQAVQKSNPARGNALLSGNRHVFRLLQNRNGDAASKFYTGNLLSQTCGGKRTDAAVRP